MEYKVQITDEAGNVQQYVVSSSSSSEDKSLNDFILEALQISEDKRELPVKIQCPNGLEVAPSIKMKFGNYGSSIPGDKLEAMYISWRDGITANGSQVYLVADLNAQNFQISNNLNK